MIEDVLVEVNTNMTANALTKLSLILGRSRIMRSIIMGVMFLIGGIVLIFVSPVAGIIVAVCGALLAAANPMIMFARISKSAKAAFASGDTVISNVKIGKETISVKFLRTNVPTDNKKNELAETVSWTNIKKIYETKEYYVLSTMPMHGILLDKNGIDYGNIQILSEIIEEKLAKKPKQNKK